MPIIGYFPVMLVLLSVWLPALDHNVLTMIAFGQAISYWIAALNPLVTILTVKHFRARFLWILSIGRYALHKTTVESVTKANAPNTTTAAGNVFYITCKAKQMAREQKHKQHK